jgi:hypothetical protein
MQYSQGSVLFTCTFGGRREKGQIWKLTPSVFEGTSDEKKNPGYLELYLEPNDADLLENADNVTVSPGRNLPVGGRHGPQHRALLKMGRF